MRLLSWNVNGIRAVHKRGDLDWLWTSDADVVCLQETKLQEADIPDALKALDGWTSYWSSGEKKGYSGVVTLVRDHIPSQEVAKGFGDERFDKDGRIQITDHDAFILLNIYFPNGGRGPEHVAHKMAFYAKFHELVNGYRDDGRDVVVCGDVNTAHHPIDTARPDNIGMRIDYFFVNDDLGELVEDAWTSPQVMGSDHCPVGLELAIDFDDEEEDEDDAW